MKVAIVGYGRMGREVASILDEREIEYVIIDTAEDVNAENLSGVDVAIDFTEPDQVVSNVAKFAEFKVNAVIGTTGWYDDMDKLKDMAKEIGCVWASNFSVGMNLFYRIVAHATKLMNNFEEYDSYLYEMHHNKKKDSPSGTAVTLGQIMLDNSSKTKVVHGQLGREKESHELHIASVRAGNIPGVHTVGFDSEADTIELSHNARSRKGFAAGAVLAAEFIVGKKGFFEFKDIIDGIIGDKNA